MKDMVVLSFIKYVESLFYPRLINKLITELNNQGIHLLPYIYRCWFKRMGWLINLFWISFCARLLGWCITWALTLSKPNSSTGYSIITRIMAFFLVTTRTLWYRIFYKKVHYQRILAYLLVFRNTKIWYTWFGLFYDRFTTSTYHQIISTKRNM